MHISRLKQALGCPTFAAFCTPIYLLSAVLLLVASRAFTITCSTNQIKSTRTATVAFHRELQVHGLFREVSQPHAGCSPLNCNPHTQNPDVLNIHFDQTRTQSILRALSLSGLTPHPLASRRLAASLTPTPKHHSSSSSISCLLLSHVNLETPHSHSLPTDISSKPCNHIWSILRASSLSDMAPCARARGGNMAGKI